MSLLYTDLNIWDKYPEVGLLNFFSYSSVCLDHSLAQGSFCIDNITGDLQRNESFQKEKGILNQWDFIVTHEEEQRLCTVACHILHVNVFSHTLEHFYWKNSDIHKDRVI